MGQTETALKNETIEKMESAGSPAEEKQASLGSVTRRPFVLEKRRGSNSGNLALMLIVLGAIVVFGIGMVVFLSTKGTVRKGLPKEATQPNLGQSHTSNPGGDIIPNDQVKPTPNGAPAAGTVDAADIERTKSPQIAQTLSQGKLAARPSRTPGSLGEVGKFEEPDTAPNAQSRWTPPPYGSESSQNQQAAKKAEDALSAPSLVFTAHEQSPVHAESPHAVPVIDNLGLVPGYHVAARIESMATTAVNAPVVAVIEYNYESDGQVIIPAGARAVGKITQADPSGLVNIAFSSLEYPDGSTVSIDAVAADMSLQAIKGKVTGRQRGKSMLVRSLSGIGETAAMIVGAPGANSGFSENDLMRMQVANNIGNAGDEQIMKMLTLEHIVVSVPAGTEIYIVFAKPSSVGTSTTNGAAQAPRGGNGFPQIANTAQQQN
ncbi:MAG TPA: hypothetical protein VMV57_10275 [Terracidiphilus sp.]|nr:hypothetical protein [Terracidiphilus sp.]